MDAARALALVDVTDREELKTALRSVLVHRVEDFPPFADCFDAFWGGGQKAPTAWLRRNAPPAPKKEKRVPLSLDRWMRNEGQQEVEREEALLPAPSALESLGRQDFASFHDEALRDVTRVARRIARRLALRPSRRWEPGRNGARPHLRRTLRLSVKTGGELSELAFRQRKVRRTKLVVLADVSGSMDLYVRLFLQFLFALQHSFARVETFAFSTRLTRITEQLKRRGYAQALDELASEVTDWNGARALGTPCGRSSKAGRGFWTETPSSLSSVTVGRRGTPRCWARPWKPCTGAWPAWCGSTPSWGARTMSPSPKAWWPPYPTWTSSPRRMTCPASAQLGSAPGALKGGGGDDLRASPITQLACSAARG